jgi:hypothetical protein
VIEIKSVPDTDVRDHLIIWGEWREPVQGALQGTDGLSKGDVRHISTNLPTIGRDFGDLHKQVSKKAYRVMKADRNDVAGAVVLPEVTSIVKEIALPPLQTEQ